MPAVDVGDVVPVSVVVLGQDGDPADATAVACTVTLPDGSTISPVVARTGVGAYQALVPVASAGLYAWRMVATGSNACAFHDGFTARDASVVPLLGLADVKEWLNKTASVSASDEELRSTVDAATALAEAYCARALRPRTWTGVVTATASGVLVLPQPAALSVSSVVAVGGAARSRWRLDGTGQTIVAAVDDPGFVGDFTVTARLGVSGGALDIAQQGVRELVRHMWAPQRGAAPLPMGGGDLPRPGSAHALPFVVTEKLDQIALVF